MRRYLAVVAMSGVLMVPVAVSAQEHRAEGQQTRQYQDKAHNDTHEWNSTESQRYNEYLKEHHKKQHDFERASKREQADYWNWRHQHPDDHR